MYIYSHKYKYQKILSKLKLCDYAENHVFGSSNLNGPKIKKDFLWGHFFGNTIALIIPKT